MSNNWSNQNMRHAKLTYPPPQVHTSHPYRHAENHQALLEYLQQRLQVGKTSRDGEIGRLVKVDKRVAGWMKKSEADLKRDREQDRTGKAKMQDINLPLAFIHLDDMMTYYAQTFAPNRGMFFSTGSPNEVDPANQIVTKMNNDAIYSGYYREVLLGIFSLLKYNCGGFTLNWKSDQGLKIVSKDNGSGGVTQAVESEVRWQGNCLKAIDRYNLLCDPSVNPSRLHCDGEFAAIAEVRSQYWLQQKASTGAYYNCDKALNEFAGAGQQMVYYRHPPSEAQFDQNQNGNDDNSSSTNWVSILSEAPNTMMGAHELVTIHIRLNPNEFGLIQGKPRERSRYEIWRFTILNDTYIIDAEWMNNIHNHLPYYMGLVHDDSMGTSQRSVGELLEPLQSFASSLLNIHIAGSRAEIWGTTIYDPTRVNMSKIDSGEVAARLPCEPAGYGKDIRESVWRPDVKPGTRDTMQDVESVMGIINQFFPTQSLPSQIASIDRAVTDQVAAVQQGANRRQQKTARLIDDTLFSKIRFAMYYNIVQFQPDGEEITDYFTGKPVKLELNQLRSTNLPFIIGQGLKALDRMALTSSLQQIIFALIQAPQAAQDIDILKMIDYWASMMDMEINMEEFRLTPEQIAAKQGGVPGQPGAPAAEGGAPIQPATDPANITAPIYS